MKKMLVVAAVAAVAFLGTASTASASAFGQCPGVGSNPNGCQFLITFNADGSISTAAATGGDNVPFDLVEDTLIGIQNNRSTPLAFLDLGPALGLNGIPVFEFDGDGACSGLYAPQPVCTGHDPTGYGGFVSPNSTGLGAVGAGGAVTFTNISANTQSGRVVFGPGGIPTNGSAWFSLEDAFTLSTLPVGRVPEPGSLVLLGTGILAVARRLRKA
jgi:hypothetical protein